MQCTKNWLWYTAVDADFILSGKVLPTVTQYRDLGVTIVSDLSSTQYKCKKLISLKHLVRTNVAESHN